MSCRYPSPPPLQLPPPCYQKSVDPDTTLSSVLRALDLDDDAAKFDLLAAELPLPVSTSRPSSNRTVVMTKNRSKAKNSPPVRLQMRERGRSRSRSPRTPSSSSVSLRSPSRSRSNSSSLVTSPVMSSVVVLDLATRRDAAKKKKRYTSSPERQSERYKRNRQARSFRRERPYYHNFTYYPRLRRSKTVTTRRGNTRRLGCFRDLARNTDASSSPHKETHPSTALSAFLRDMAGVMIQNDLGETTPSSSGSTSFSSQRHEVVKRKDLQCLRRPDSFNATTSSTRPRVETQIVSQQRIEPIYPRLARDANSMHDVQSVLILSPKIEGAATLALRQHGYELYTFATFVRTVSRLLNSPFSQAVVGDQTVFRVLEKVLDENYALRRFVAWLENQKQRIQAVMITGLDERYAQETVASFCNAGAIYVDRWPQQLEALCAPLFHWPNNTVPIPARAVKKQWPKPGGLPSLSQRSAYPHRAGESMTILLLGPDAKQIEAKYTLAGFHSYNIWFTLHEAACLAFAFEHVPNTDELARLVRKLARKLQKVYVAERQGVSGHFLLDGFQEWCRSQICMQTTPMQVVVIGLDPVKDVDIISLWQSECGAKTCARTNTLAECGEISIDIVLNG